MTDNISKNKIGFDRLAYTLTALPLIPFLKLEGFATDGITWEDVEHTKVNLGADGFVAINNVPVLYQGTLNLMANSNSRNAIDNLIFLSTPQAGKKALDYVLVLTEKNYTTQQAYTYIGGTFTKNKAGNDANLDDGQQTKTYSFTFTNKISIPFND